MGIADWVHGWTDPIYEWAFAHFRELILIVTVIVLLRLISKIRKRIKARQNQRKKAGSTNEWFSWEEYEKWKNSNRREDLAP